MQKIISGITIVVPWVLGVVLVFLGLFKIGIIVWFILFILGLIYRKKFTIWDAEPIVIFGIIAFFVFILRDFRFYPYTGSIVYSVLFVTMVFSLIINKPSAIPEKLQALRAHYVRTSFWAVVFIISDILSIVLMPSFWYIIAPLLVILFGFLMDMILLKRIL